ncbi:MAG: DUF411 domain-containing protein [Alphaproteobacteria bacterium]|nr:DUF411 domain-containing protein [Alphaproteobacteria bacterium]
MRKIFAVLTIAMMLIGSNVTVADEPSRHATLYRNPECGCCEAYAEYLRKNGFSVTVKLTHSLPLIKRQHNVQRELEGCHTTLVGGYVVEGHVPVGTINRLLSERPAIRGISLPGMPEGSPGMSGPKREPFTIYEITDGSPRVYAVE